MFSLLSMRNWKLLVWRNTRSWLSPLILLAAAAGGMLLLSVALSVEMRPSLPSIACGLLIAGLLLPLFVGGRLSRQGRAPTQLSQLETPFLLAHDRELFDQYRQYSRSLLQISQQGDPIYRRAALTQVSQMAEQVERIGAGTLVYEGTETWRMVYETLLRSPGIARYRSVARLQNVGYWLDEPGLQSMRLNLELQAASQVQVERIAIIAEPLWPRGDFLPVEPVRQWIHEQHSHGIDIRLIRQSDLTREPDLVVDMGIYGSRAVGFQELGENCQTEKFTLTFDFDRLVAAESIWDRLIIYASRYANLLDRHALDAYDPEPADPFLDD